MHILRCEITAILMSRSTNVAPLLIDSRDWPRVAAAITECQLGFFSHQKCGLIRDAPVLFILHSNLFFCLLPGHHLFIDSSLSRNTPSCMNK